MEKKRPPIREVFFACRNFRYEKIPRTEVQGIGAQHLLLRGEIIHQRMAGMLRDERVLQQRSAVSDDERRYRLHDEE